MTHLYRSTRALAARWLVSGSTLLLCLALFAPELDAQVIRGIVIDSTRRPVAEALVTLLNTSQQPVGDITARTDSLGRFGLFTRDGGTYLVRVTRIGYTPSVSVPIKLDKTDMTQLQIVLRTTAAQVATVFTLAKRRLTPTELDGRTGFEYRRAHQLGHFLTDSDFVGLNSLDDVVRTGKAGFIKVPSQLDNQPLQIGARAGSFSCSAPNHNIVLLLDGHPIQHVVDDLGNIEPDWEGLEGRAVVSEIAAVEVYDRGKLPPGAIGLVGGAVAAEPKRDGGNGKITLMSPPRGFSDVCVVLVWTKGYFRQMDYSAADEAATRR